ncbi:MAG: hypothetical protein OEP95_04410, partial [Myxococcales bacterium]|nr:hypothetical protein [Myxococcales bacterium]
MSRTALGLVLLAALGAGGGWNYQRNLALEAAERPFSQYSTEQLEALVAGYESEVNDLSGRYSRKQAHSSKAKGGRLIDENIAAFDATHAHGAAVRQLGGDLSQREAEFADLRAELAFRD